MRFIRVDFPDPDGPMTATYSFFWICTLHAAERPHELGAHVVLARQLVRQDG